MSDRNNQQTSKEKSLHCREKRVLCTKKNNKIHETRLVYADVYFELPLILKVLNASDIFISLLVVSVFTSFISGFKFHSIIPLAPE